MLPRHRRKGYGLLILQHLAKVAVERDCARFEWVALNWNTPALNFYKQLGAVAMDDWILHRLSDQALLEVAKKAR